MIDLVDRLEEAVRFLTPGKEGKGKYDFVGKVLNMFYDTIPDFARSEVSREGRRNGWTIQGSYPSSGKHVLDWEFDVWGERGGDVIVKINVWSTDGRNDGLSYRTNVATAKRAIMHFKKWYGNKKKEMTGKNET